MKIIFFNLINVKDSKIEAMNKLQYPIEFNLIRHWKFCRFKELELDKIRIEVNTFNLQKEQEEAEMADLDKKVGFYFLIFQLIFNLGSLKYLFLKRFLI